MVIHADEDHLLESHVESQLQSHIGDRGTFPQSPAGVAGKSRALIGGVEKRGQIRAARSLAA